MECFEKLVFFAKNKNNSFCIYNRIYKYKNDKNEDIEQETEF